MSEVAIRVENLGKKYRLRHQHEGRRYKALRDVLAAIPQRLLASLKFDPQKARDRASDVEDFWALKDVSFEIRQGEAIGIIGRNGAGKSTLLKLISRITQPTTGRIEIAGSVSSLLEVGTGFHPELTGRENIYLNGSILGMSREQVRSQFDEIVAFAEVERFLDTPIKRYSSGMYMRLAFAVAAHLQPDILIVDEVLAVGDAAFQRKCLGKMDDVSKGGRTVIFVSHNMAVIQRLCGRALLLENGALTLSSSPESCIEAYMRAGMASNTDAGFLTPEHSPNRRGSGQAKFHHVSLQTFDSSQANEFRFGEPFKVLITIHSETELRDVTVGFSFVASDGLEIQGSSAHDEGIPTHLRKGLQTLECTVDPMPLVPGNYYLRGAIFRTAELFDHVDEILRFEINRAPASPYSAPADHYVGYVYFPYKWRMLS